MNREIKFRAYHLATEQMFQVHSITPTHVFPETMDGIHTSEINPAMREGCALMQYTGLKDKKGAEIYEGDILEYKYPDRMEATGWGADYAPVVFKEGTFGTIGSVTASFLPIEGARDAATWEVIGNVHEHPELLRTKLATQP
ncbi:YopX family protein [Nibribacter koreensis]|uniref:YopX family protein n=1 Tax=Nibribacter koreensis TaxID=1084519 RepID=A0ABP8FB48_9BACT